jgi:hypothetical protein
MITLPTKKSGFMRVLFLMLLVMTLMWNCSENSRKCVEFEIEFEITEEDVSDIKIATTECTKWADEVTKTSN